MKFVVAYIVTAVVFLGLDALWLSRVALDMYRKEIGSMLFERPSLPVAGVFYLIFAVAGHGLNNAMQSVFSKYAGSDNSAVFKTILSQGIRVSLYFALIGILITWLLAPLILRSVADPAAFISSLWPAAASRIASLHAGI